MKRSKMLEDIELVFELNGMVCYPDLLENILTAIEKAGMLPPERRIEYTKHFTSHNEIINYGENSWDLEDDEDNTHINFFV